MHSVNFQLSSSWLKRVEESDPRVEEAVINNKDAMNL